MPPDLTGILNVNKPKGWTSHDVVAKVRRLAGQKRVGHAGTLDPMAEGVLPVLLGRATRLADFIQAGRKVYAAVIMLGVATETDDAEGAVLSTSDVPPLSPESLLEALASFEGEILQAPPRYSALKVDGRRAYAVARAGGAVTLAPRRVTIYRVSLLGCTADRLAIEVECSKGTYIRALARDIAVRLGTVGHLAELRRTRVGHLTFETAQTMENLAQNGIANYLEQASCVIPEAPAVSANEHEAAKLRNGQPIVANGLQADAVWVYDPVGLLLCLASADGAQLRPRLML